MQETENKFRFLQQEVVNELGLNPAARARFDNYVSLQLHAAEKRQNGKYQENVKLETQIQHWNNNFYGELKKLGQSGDPDKVAEALAVDKAMRSWHEKVHGPGFVAGVINQVWNPEEEEKKAKAEGREVSFMNKVNWGGLAGALGGGLLLTMTGEGIFGQMSTWFKAIVFAVGAVAGAIGTNALVNVLSGKPADGEKPVYPTAKKEPEKAKAVEQQLSMAPNLSKAQEEALQAGLVAELKDGKQAFIEMRDLGHRKEDPNNIHVKTREEGKKTLNKFAKDGIIPPPPGSPQEQLMQEGKAALQLGVQYDGISPVTLPKLDSAVKLTQDKVRNARSGIWSWWP